MWPRTGFDAGKMRESSKKIEEEAYAFCAWEDGIQLPDESGNIIDFEYIPEEVVLKRRVDAYGLPFSGGWAEQPHAFITILEAARRGEEQYKREKDGQEKNAMLHLMERLR